MEAVKIDPANKNLLPGKPVLKKLADIEKDHILFVLKELHWKKDVAARVLGIDRKTLYRRLQEYGVQTTYERISVIKSVEVLK